MSKTYEMTGAERGLAARAPERWTGATDGSSRRNEDGTVTVRQWSPMLGRYVVRVLDPESGTYYFEEAG